MPNRRERLKAQRFSDAWRLKDNLYFSKALTLGRTSWGGGGGGLVATTPKVFSDFFPLDYKTSVPEVFCRCSRLSLASVLRQV